MTESVDPGPIKFRPGHGCNVRHTRNDELMYLVCECSDEPVFTFTYPPSPDFDSRRPKLDEVEAAVAAHYVELDVI